MLVKKFVHVTIKAYHMDTDHLCDGRSPHSRDVSILSAWLSIFVDGEVVKRDPTCKGGENETLEHKI